MRDLMCLFAGKVSARVKSCTTSQSIARAWHIVEVEAMQTDVLHTYISHTDFRALGLNVKGHL
jgi:hypothetical protein